MKKRIHELLGVEPNQRFSYKSWGLFYVDENGVVWSEEDGKANGDDISCFLNEPEFITPRPALTYKQLYALKALYNVFGARYMVKNNGDVFPTVFDEMPVLEVTSPTSKRWVGDKYLEINIFGERADLRMLVHWNDTEPFDIAKALEESGVDLLQEVV